MINVLKANLVRLKKDKIIWVCGVITVLLAIIVVIMVDYSNKDYFKYLSEYKNVDDVSSNLLGFVEKPIDECIMYFPIVVAVLMIIVCSFSIGNDIYYSTIRNKLIVGSSKIQIYFGSVLTSIVVGIFYSVLWIISCLISGLFNLHFFNSWLTLLLYILYNLLIVSVFSIFYMTIILISKNILISLVINICSICLLFFSGIVTTEIVFRIEEDFFYENYQKMKDECSIKRDEKIVELLQNELKLDSLTKDERRLKEEMYDNYKSSMEGKIINVKNDNYEYGDGIFDKFCKEEYKGFFYNTTLMNFTMQAIMMMEWDSCEYSKNFYTIDGKKHSKDEVDDKEYKNYERFKLGYFTSSVSYYEEELSDNIDNINKRQNDRILELKKDPASVKLFDEIEKLDDQIIEYMKMNDNVLFKQECDIKKVVFVDLCWCVCLLTIGCLIFKKHDFK